jgi:hypothetical protein
MQQTEFKNIQGSVFDFFKVHPFNEICGDLLHNYHIEVTKEKIPEISEKNPKITETSEVLCEKNSEIRKIEVSCDPSFCYYSYYTSSHVYVREQPQVNIDENEGLEKIRLRPRNANKGMYALPLDLNESGDWKGLKSTNFIGSYLSSLNQNRSSSIMLSDDGGNDTSMQHKAIHHYELNSECDEINGYRVFFKDVLETVFSINSKLIFLEERFEMVELLVDVCITTDVQKYPFKYYNIPICDEIRSFCNIYYERFFEITQEKGGVWETIFNDKNKSLLDNDKDKSLLDNEFLPAQV